MSQSQKMASSPAQLPTPDPSLPPSEAGDHCRLKLDDGCTFHSDDEAAIEDEWLRIPDSLFYSIMSVEPVVNPNYKQSKALSDPWVAETLRLSDKHAQKWAKLDIAYMSAICAPRANLEVLKLMNDWNGWVFAFDDPFDEGAYTHDPIKAAEEVIHTLAVLDDLHPPVDADENPVRHALQSCWQRFSKLAPPQLRYRWKKQLTTYAIGVLQQVRVQGKADRRDGSKPPTVEEYMDYRAGCVGAYPCLGLMELAEGIDLPHKVVDHPALSGIARVTVDLVTLQNDICSFKKDVDTGETANIIFLLKDQGLTTQEATDRVGQMLTDCYRRWYSHLVALPYWDDSIDRQVLKYIEGCRNLALGNLTWSLYTPRYMGDQGQRVRDTRMIKLR
ncbi:isoprenoid synthase domain-containing protein [Microdochium bolleyi]|uniref:Terpene synthase n=1 Tax=Microdochium bolleyi TaxID=196109 RepID=A0A136IT11_9PEZI|nr:isoprenoid synthase domain-containing protein [Microdochium bolleyi]